MDCNGNIYNIGMGCCEPVLGPIENYYTKPTIDRMLDEITSAITSGCCITPEEVDEKIDEAISGISVSGVTEEELNEAIASAKTEIEGEIPSLDGYATEQWVEDKHYITGVDLSDYALKSEIPVVPTSNTAFTNDAGYLTEHQSLSGYATEAFVSAFTYDKATIDEKVAGGGSFDPSQYYNKTATDELLAEKLDVTAYTPVDLSNYYTTGETVSLVESAVTRVEGEIPTVPTSNTAFTNDAGYLTEHQSLSGYATEQWVEDKHYITGVDLSNYATTGDVNNVSTALTSHASNTTIHVTPEQVSNWNAKSDFSGSYNDLTDKPTIPTVPTDISAFNNDVGYITGVDLSNYATKDNLTAATDDMATKTWVGQQGYLTEHQSLTAYSTTEQVNSAITQAVSGKQDTLISGTSIKTINNESLLGSGNITIQGGSTYTAGTGIDITSDVISTTLPITTGSGQYSVVVATSDNQYKPTATGQYSYAEGMFSTATGYSSHAEGYNTKAYGVRSHAEGDATTAKGDISHAEGNSTFATGKTSHAEGKNTKAYGESSHAEGESTTASSQYSHAEGDYTLASGTSSHAEGMFATAKGYASHAEGYNTETKNKGEHASGQYNTSSFASYTFGDSGNTLFSVGNGTANDARHNAFEIRQNGDVYLNDGSKLQDNLVTSSEKTTWNNKANIWCGTMAEYQQISGSTDNNTIYLIHS